MDGPSGAKPLVGFQTHPIVHRSSPKLAIPATYQDRKLDYCILPPNLKPNFSARVEHNPRHWVSILVLNPSPICVNPNPMKLTPPQPNLQKANPQKSG